MSPAELATKILERVAQHPDRHDQAHWLRNRGQDWATSTAAEVLAHLDTIGTDPAAWPCGTTACSAGHGLAVLAEAGEAAAPAASETPAAVVADRLGVAGDSGEYQSLFYQRESDSRYALERIVYDPHRTAR